MNLMPRVWIPRRRSYDISGVRVCTLKMLQRPCQESPQHVFVQSQGINCCVRTAASGRENKKGSQCVSQCVLACDQLLFQSKLNWGQAILSRAPSPRGAAVVFELRRLSEAPAKHFVGPPYDRIRSNLTVAPPPKAEDAEIDRLPRADVLSQLSVQGTQEGGPAQRLHGPGLQHRGRRRRRGHLCVLHPSRRPRWPEWGAEARRPDLIGECASPHPCLTFLVWWGRDPDPHSQHRERFELSCFVLCGQKFT